MPIKFDCPKCEKRLAVKDELAGKRGKCKGCGTMITIPQTSRESVSATASSAKAERPATPPTPSPPPEPPPEPTQDQQKETESPTPPVEEDLEDVAADFFSEDPDEKGPGEDIEFECPECIEMVTMSASLAGQREPCPLCRRIIRVPVPDTGKPTKWQASGQGVPSGARRIEFEEKPEGAWEATSTRVSEEALDEADALPVEKEPWTLADKVRTGAYAVCGLAALGLLGIWIVSWWQGRKETVALEAALEHAKHAPGYFPAGLHTLACEYYGRGKDSENLALAEEQFKKAFGALTQSKKADPDRDTLLAELASKYLELGGSQEQVDAGSALAWDDVHEGVLASLGAIRTPSVKREALRSVARRLIELEQTKRVLPITSQAVTEPAEQSEAQAVVGIELFRSGNKDEAGAASQRALTYYKENKEAPVTQAVVALALLTGGTPPEVKEGALDQRYAIAGKIEALARQGKLDEARSLAKTAPNPAVGVALWLPLAVLQAEGDAAGTDDVVQALRAASKLPAGNDVNPWDLVRLAEVAGQVGVDDAKVEPLLGKLRRRAIKARTQFLLLQGKLKRSDGIVEQNALEAIDKRTISHGLAAAVLVRHNFDHDSDWLDIAEDWEDPTKAFGLLGAAQGLRKQAE